MWRHLFTLWIVVFGMLLLVGCGLTAEGTTVRSIVKVRGAQIMDEGLANAEWYTCRAASVGSIKRRYGRTPQDAKTYAAFCGDTPTLEELIQ